MWSGRDFGTHQTRLAIGTSNFVTYFRADLHICHYFIFCRCWAGDETWNDVLIIIGSRCPGGELENLQKHGVRN